MRPTSALVAFLAFAVSLSAALQAQEPALTPAAVDQSASQPLPTLARHAARIPELAGKTAQLRFALYSSPDPDPVAEPLWQEEQPVAFDPQGRYAVQLGAASASGLPASLFLSGQPRWLAVSENRRELSRTLLGSVPYALKAADANTLAGLPAAAFVTQAQLAGLRSAPLAPSPAAVTPNLAAVTGSGSNGVIPLWTGASTFPALTTAVPVVPPPMSTTAASPSSRKLATQEGSSQWRHDRATQVGPPSCTCLQELRPSPVRSTV